MKMREIVLDTETTGLDPTTGDRIVEIGAIELHNHLPSGKTYHQYINPERDMPEGAFAVHGLSTEFLSKKPVFAEIVDDFLHFIGDEKLIIHNASFDMKFINAELDRLGKKKLPANQAIDTLAIARKRFAGAQNSLDALCRRFGVDNTRRDIHGALLDSELLAGVYLELIGGRQPDFGLTQTAKQGNTQETSASSQPFGKRPTPLPSRLSKEENEKHAEFVNALSENPLWRKFDAK